MLDFKQIPTTITTTTISEDYLTSILRNSIINLHQRDRRAPSGQRGHHFQNLHARMKEASSVNLLLTPRSSIDLNLPIIPCVLMNSLPQSLTDLIVQLNDPLFGLNMILPTKWIFILHIIQLKKMKLMEISIMLVGFFLIPKTKKTRVFHWIFQNDKVDHRPNSQDSVLISIKRI